MRRGARIGLLVLLAAGPLDASISDRFDDLSRIAGEFVEFAARLDAFTQKRAELVAAGRIVEVPEGYTVFEGDTQAGFYRNSRWLQTHPEGKDPEYVYVAQPEKDADYITFRKERHGKREFNFVVESRNGTCTLVKLEIGGEEIVYRPAVAGQDEYIEYSRPGTGYHLFGFRGQPMLRFGDALRDAVFRGKDARKRRELVEEVLEDFPNDAVLRIVLRAIDEGVNLADPRATALFAANYHRDRLGLPRVRYSEVLERSGHNHLRFLHQNRIMHRIREREKREFNSWLLLHDEEKGKPGYTGKEATERAHHVGYEKYVYENAGGFATNPIEDVQNWYDTIYHRRPFLDSRIEEIAWCRLELSPKADDNRTLMLFGFDATKSLRPLVFCPFDGQKDFPAIWCGMEAPLPFPERSPPWSMPFSVTCGADHKKGTVRLYGGDGEVPLLLDHVVPGENFLEYVAERPLSPGAAYRAVYTYGDGEKEIRFKTAPADDVRGRLEELRGSIAGSVDARVRFEPLVEVRRRAKPVPDENGIEKSTNATTVRNDRFGFSISVPPTWKVTERKHGATVNIDTPTGSVSVFPVFVTPATTLDDLIESAIRGTKRPARGRETRQVGGVPVRIVTHPKDREWDVRSLHVLARNLYLQVWFWSKDAKEIDAFLAGLSPP